MSIAVLAVSPHRDAAFLAAKYGIDETKGRVPIWKAERFEDGHVWIGEPARTEAPARIEAPARTGEGAAVEGRRRSGISDSTAPATQSLDDPA